MITFVHSNKKNFGVKSQQPVITLNFYCLDFFCACLSLLLSCTQTHTSKGRWEASLLAPPPVSRTCTANDVKGSFVIKSVLVNFIVLRSSGQSLTIRTDWIFNHFYPPSFFLSFSHYHCIFITIDTIDSHEPIRN